MEYMTKLILGTVQLGIPYGISNISGIPSKEDAFVILETAHTAGIHYLDTAFGYGESHQVIKNFMKTTNKDFHVITKITNDISFSVLKDFCIQLDTIYGCLLHDAHNIDTDIFHGLQRLQEQGLIQHIGISVYSNEQFEKAIYHPAVKIIQFPCNLLDNSTRKGGLIKKAKQKDKILHARSVFLQGLFFKDVAQLPQKLIPLRHQLKEVRSIALEHDYTLSELALNYVYHNKYIDGVLIGVETLEQLQINISSIQTNFSQEIIGKINQITVKETELLNPSNW